jgi:uridine kinase
MDLEPLFKRITALMKTKNRVIVAIDGQAAAGKSTVAQTIGAKFPASVIHMDDYFLPDEKRTKERRKEVGGNVDYERFQAEVIDHLTDDTIHHVAYDCKTKRFRERPIIRDPRMLIIEGAYSQRSEWRSHYDLKVVITIDPTLQMRRIVRRNGIEMSKRFEHEWIVFENRYLKEQKVIEHADLRIHLNDTTDS